MHDLLSYLRMDYVFEHNTRRDLSCHLLEQIPSCEFSHLIELLPFDTDLSLLTLIYLEVQLIRLNRQIQQVPLVRLKLLDKSGSSIVFI